MLKSVILLIVGFFIGAVVCYAALFSKINTSKPSEVPIIAQNESPVPLSLLKNPIIYQWRGSVEGTLTSKTASQITIGKDGNSIDIPIVKATDFFGEIKNNTREKITLGQIPVGSYVRGEFFAYPWEGPEVIKGSLFTIEKLP